MQHFREFLQRPCVVGLGEHSDNHAALGSRSLQWAQYHEMSNPSSESWTARAALYEARHLALRLEVISVATREQAHLGTVLHHVVQTSRHIVDVCWHHKSSAFTKHILSCNTNIAFSECRKISVNNTVVTDNMMTLYWNTKLQSWDKLLTDTEKEVSPGEDLRSEVILLIKSTINIVATCNTVI